MGKGLLAAFLAAILPAGCTTDTSGLAYRPEAAVAEPNDGPARVVAVVAGTSGQAGASAMPTGQVEPSPQGGGSIQLLNGLVNASKGWACIRGAAEDNATEELVALNFAQPVVISSERSSASPNLVVELFADTRSATSSTNCEQLRDLSEVAFLAPPTEVDNRLVDAGTADGGRGDAGALTPSLEVARAGFISVGRDAFLPGDNYLLVVTGCASFGLPLDVARCGARQGATGDAHQLVAVSFANAPNNGVGIQFLHASRGSEPLDVTLQYEGSANGDLSLSASAAFGSLRPRLPALFGDGIRPLTMTGVDVRLARANIADYGQAWEATLTYASMPLLGAYTLVYVGSNPRAAAKVGFQQPKLLLLPAEPAPQ